MTSKDPLVLVVEDEELLLSAIEKKLNLVGINTVKCQSGKAALEFSQNTDEIPDVIWLDYHLKDMDGLTFLTEVKKDDKWKDVPVIVVSNSASPDKVHSMLGLGASKYLLKAEHKLEDIANIIKELAAAPAGEKQE